MLKAHLQPDAAMTTWMDSGHQMSEREHEWPESEVRAILSYCCSATSSVRWQNRLIEARLSSADLVQRKGLGSALARSRYAVMAASRPAFDVRAPVYLTEPYRLHPLGPVERLDLAFFVDAQHDRFVGRVHVEADHIDDFLGKNSDHSIV